MNFLQIGLGSMGKRRIRNLLHHKIPPKNIWGVDLDPEKRARVEKEYGIKTHHDFRKAYDLFQPDAFIISTPPNMHDTFFLFAAEKEKHFFVEVATSDKGYNKLLPLLKPSFVAAPSCTFRFYTPVKRIKDILEHQDMGKIWAFQHYLGQYLPDWHPWEDYRKFYVSKQESSACKEMVPYELQWLQWVLNDTVVEAQGLIAKCSNLEFSAADVYSASLKMAGGAIGSLMVDVVARKPARTLRILCSEGVIYWDWLERTISIFHAKNNKTDIITLDQEKKLKEYSTTTEEMYEKELESFLHAIQGLKKYPYSFREDQHNFILLDQIEKGGQHEE